MTPPIRDALALLMGPLPSADLAWLEKRVELRHYSPGFAVCLEGQVSRQMFLLVEGRLRITKLRPDKRQEEIARIQPAALLGHSAVIGRTPYPTTIAALEPSICLHVPRSLLRPCADPRSGPSALRLLEVSVRGMNAQLRSVNAHLLTIASERDLIEDLAHDLGAWSPTDPP